MKRKIKKIDKIKTDSGIKYQLFVEAIPTWFDKIFFYSKRNEFYIGYGSVWYRYYFGDLEAISTVEWGAECYVKRCTSSVNQWLIKQFVINKLSLHKRK